MVLFSSLLEKLLYKRMSYGEVSWRKCEKNLLLGFKSECRMRCKFKIWPMRSPTCDQNKKKFNSPKNCSHGHLIVVTVIDQDQLFLCLRLGSSTRSLLVFVSHAAATAAALQQRGRSLKLFSWFFALFLQFFFFFFFTLCQLHHFRIAFSIMFANATARGRLSDVRYCVRLDNGNLQLRFLRLFSFFSQVKLFDDDPWFQIFSKYFKKGFKFLIILCTIRNFIFSK